MKKNLKIILGISLAFNLLFIGFVAGSFFGSKAPLMPRHHNQMKHFPHHEESLIKSLSEEKQNSAREVLAKMHEIRKNGHKNKKKIIENITNIVKAEKFDEKEFLKHFKKLGDEFIKNKDQCDLELAKFLSTLNKEDRTNLLEKFQSIYRPFGKKSMTPGKDHRKFIKQSPREKFPESRD